MASFIKCYDSKSLMRQPTCHNNPNNLTCSNLRIQFKSTCVIVTGLSDVYFITITVMKSILGDFKTKQSIIDDIKIFLKTFFERI